MALYRSLKDDWQIAAEGLHLVQTLGPRGKKSKPPRASFKTPGKLLAAARKAIKTKTSRDRYVLEGNHEAGTGAEEPPVLSPAVRKEARARPDRPQP